MSAIIDARPAGWFRAARPELLFDPSLQNIVLVFCKTCQTICFSICLTGFQGSGLGLVLTLLLCLRF
jgi:hypothetical protein